MEYKPQLSIPDLPFSNFFFWLIKMTTLVIPDATDLQNKTSVINLPITCHLKNLTCYHKSNVLLLCHMPHPLLWQGWLFSIALSYNVFRIYILGPIFPFKAPNSLKLAHLSLVYAKFTVSNSFQIVLDPLSIHFGHFQGTIQDIFELSTQANSKFKTCHLVKVFYLVKESSFPSFCFVNSTKLGSSILSCFDEAITWS